MYERVRIDFAEKLGISNITPKDLLDETIRLNISEEHRETYQEKTRANPPSNSLSRYKRSFFQVFEIFLQQKLICLKMILYFFK